MPTLTPPTVRTSWPDARDYTVHAVELPLAAWPASMREQLVDALRRDWVTLALKGDDGWRTVCGVPLTERVTLDPREPVTCDGCLAAEGAPAVEMALRLMLADRVPGTAVGA